MEINNVSIYISKSKKECKEFFSKKFYRKNVYLYRGNKINKVKDKQKINKIKE